MLQLLCLVLNVQKYNNYVLSTEKSEQLYVMMFERVHKMWNDFVRCTNYYLKRYDAQTYSCDIMILSNT